MLNFGPILSVISASNAQRKQKEAYSRTRAIADDQARQMREAVKPAWFDPKRSDFWNDPNRWDGIDDPHTEIFWMKRRVDRIDCGAPKRVDPQLSAEWGDNLYAGMGGATGVYLKQVYGTFR